MTEFKKDVGRNYWFSLGVFILILIIISIMFINIKKKSRVDVFVRDMNADLVFIKDSIFQGLQKGDYTIVDSLLRGWAKLHRENILELKLIASNGFIISQYSNKEESTEFIENSIDIEYSYNKKATLNVKYSLTLINKEMINDFIFVSVLLFLVSFVLIYITRILVKRSNILFVLEKQAVELRKLSSSVEQSPSSIVITDLKGNIEFVNPKFSHVTGYSFEDSVGQNPRILKTEKLSQDDYKNLWDTILRGEIWRGEFYNKKKNGEFYWEDATIGPIKDESGSITNFIAIKTDITKEKKISEELEKYQKGLEILVKERTREIEETAFDMKENQQALMYLVEDANESREELENLNKKMNRSLKKVENSKDQIDGILKSMADGLIVTDFDEKVILVNHIAEEIFSINAKDLIGKSVDSFINDKELLEKFKISFADSETGHNFDFKITSNNVNLSRIYNARVSAIWDKNGVVTGLITTLRDVTTEREIDRMKTEFISTSAHELRTPLTSIKGFSEILITRKDLKKKDREKFMEYIYKQSERLGNLINDLLDVSKIEAGQGFILKKKKCNAGEILESALSSFKEISKNHTFRIEISDNPGELYIDKDLILQALSNLLSNAVKYSPEGCEILISGDISMGNYVISVYDEGIGMTKDQIDNIFEKFYRADASNTAIEGTGLGMAIVKNIVESHGGEIRVESEFGKWTLVTFTIPLIEEKGN